MTNTRSVLLESDVAGVVQGVLDMPMASDGGASALRREGAIGQIECHFAGLVPQSGLGAAMQDPASDADDALDQWLPFGVGNRVDGGENIDLPGFVAIA